MCAINSRKSGSQRKAHFGSLSLLRVSCKQESTPPCVFQLPPEYRGRVQALPTRLFCLAATMLLARAAPDRKSVV